MRTGKGFIRAAGIVVAALAVVLAAMGGADIGTHDAVEAAPGTPADLIAAGGQETCLVENGAAWCQGYNNNGQLGNDSTADSWIPVQVSNAASGVTAIAVGDAHACAVQNGGVECWGDNVDGQLGNSSVLDVHHPVAVSGLGSGMVAVAVGAAHSCALTTGGAVLCWGAANNGQLGNGSTTGPQTCAHSCSQTPVPVTGLSSGVTAISAAGYETCAIQGGAVLCWGPAYLNSGTIVSTPTGVSGLASGVSGIATGYTHACAIQNDGAVCWGRNASGQLGNGNLSDSPTPVPVNNLGAGVTAITAGRHAGNNQEQSCAVQNGAALCWGANYWGQLGNNTVSQFGYSALAVPVSGLSSGVTALTAGDTHTCALTSNGGGGAYCWGADQNGQVGNAATAGCAATVGGGPGTGLVCSIVPVPLAAPGSALGVTALTSGGDSSCALKDASVWCWGNDEWIDNSANNVAAAVAALGSGVTAVATGKDHACAIQGGAALCWGQNPAGQLGNNSLTDSAAPVQVTNLGTNVTAISSGSHYGNQQEHSCAIQNGGVWCWGAGWNGQLGNGQTANSPIPVQPTGLTAGVIALASGDSHTCALTTGGAVSCWGYNGYGQVGAAAADTCTGGAPCAKTPVPVPGLTSGVTAIAAGGYETCAIQAGAAKCWGDGAGGALGNNGIANSSTPVAVSGLTSGVSAIAVGGGANASADGHACAVQNGGLWCWGFNANGQLGNNSVLQAHAPVAVQGLGSGVATVTAGFDHSCALTTTGVVWCWGHNNLGQVGNNGAADSHVPAPVLGLPHPAPPSAPGPTIAVGTASLVSGSVRVPVSTSGSGFNAYRGFNVHLRWAPSVFSFSSIDTTGTVVNGAYCATPIPDGDGGGVVFGCAATAGPTAGTGLLATILLTANNTGCSNIHLTTFGAPDGAGDMNGTYTVDASSYQAQVNTTADGTGDWSGASGCAQDVDGDGYSDATEIGLGKNPNVFCRIMRADINGDGKVNIVDLSALASHYNQTVPPAPARDDQNGDAKINIIDLSSAAGVYNQLVSACP